jgi:hypothetical protein
MRLSIRLGDEPDFAWSDVDIKNRRTLRMEFV